MRTLILIAMSLGIVYGILRFKHHIEKFYHEALVTDSAPVSRGATGASLLRGSRNDLATQIQSDLSIDPECKTFAASVERLNLGLTDVAKAALTYQKIPAVPEDCHLHDNELDSAVLTMTNHCRPLNHVETVADLCRESLVALRSAMTRHRLSLRPVSSVQDPRELIDLLYAEFVSASHQTTPDLKRAKSVAVRLLDLRPQLAVAAKAIAFAEVLQAISAQLRRGEGWRMNGGSRRVRSNKRSHSIRKMKICRKPRC